MKPQTALCTSLPSSAMATKRPSMGPAGRPPKKRRADDPVLAVVDTFTGSEVLPTDVKQLLERASRIVRKPNNTHRDSHENEIVDQAEKALIRVQADFKQKHAEALEAQNEVIAPAEQQRRTEAKKVAEEGLEAATAKLEASREVQSAARKAFHDAQIVLKNAQKDAAIVERDMKTHAAKKTVLSDLLAKEFETLLMGTNSTAQGQAAAKKLVKYGKECNLDETLLKTVPLTCGRGPSTRSEFEKMVFTSLKADILNQIDDNSKKLSALAPSKTEKLAAVTNAKINMEKKEAAATEAREDASNTQTALKDAEKHARQAEEHSKQIWDDMKKACDAQDGVAKNAQNFTEQVLKPFQQQKEKAGVEEPVEEEAGVEAEAEAPREAETAMVDDKAEEPTEEEEAAVEAEAAVEPAVSQEPAEEVEEPAEDLSEEETAEAEAAAASMEAKPAVSEAPAEEVVELAEEPTEEEEAEAEADAAPPMETEPAVSEEPAEEVVEPAKEPTEQEDAEAEADAAATM